MTIEAIAAGQPPLLERIVTTSIRLRWAVLAAVLVLCALGIWSFQRLPIDATPDITVAAAGDSTGQDSACVGLKWMCGSALAGITSLGVKTTTAALSLVAVKKFGKDATLAVSASSKYDAPGAPSYGAQLTIG